MHLSGTSTMCFRLLLASCHSEEIVVIVDGVKAVPYLSFSTVGQIIGNMGFEALINKIV